MSLPGGNLNIDSALGAPLIGFACSCVAYGILCSQVFRYYQRFPYDKLAYKFFVAGLWTVETVDQAFIGHSIYHYLVTNFAEPLTLLVEKPIWTLILQLTLGAIVGCMVKCAFAMRVWTFSKHNSIITGFILLLTVTQLGLAINFTVQCFGISTILELHTLKLAGSISLGIGVFTDITIALSLCFYLRKLRTGYSKSDKLANSLMIRALDTGIVTSAISLTTLVLYNVNSSNFVFMCFYFVLSKLYAITFLAALDTRKSAEHRKTEQGKKMDMESGAGDMATVIGYQSSLMKDSSPSLDVEARARRDLSMTSDTLFDTADHTEIPLN